MTDSEMSNEAEPIEGQQDAPGPETPEAPGVAPNAEAPGVAPNAEPGAPAAVETSVAETTPDASSTDSPIASDTAAAADSVTASDTGTPVTFERLEGITGAAGGAATLELLYDLSLPLTVELGRAAMTVQDLLALGQGSVIRLDRMAGDPVDVYVGTKKLAQAEVVVLEDQFGIRITQIYPEAGMPQA